VSKLASEDPVNNSV